MGKRYDFRAAVYLILRDGNKLLMQQRINTNHEDGNYSVIAGHLDGGETVQQGMVREALEEAGITIKSEDLKVVHVMHNRAAGHNEYFNVFLTTNTWEETPTNMEPDRCGDLSWFPIGDLPSNTVGYVRHALEQIERGIFFSSWGFE